MFISTNLLIPGGGVPAAVEGEGRLRPDGQPAGRHYSSVWGAGWGRCVSRLVSLVSWWSHRLCNASTQEARGIQLKILDPAISTSGPLIRLDESPSCCKSVAAFKLRHLEVLLFRLAELVS